ncbi:MAG: response regulator [Kofleriaceae bacterium]|nr:response regulator [Kofleriaceae bacterium]
MHSKEEWRAASGLSVLVVDDDLDIREYLQDFLQAEGYRVETLGDPSAAIERLREEVFHLLVLDLMMPKLSGLELLAQVRAVDSDIAVIVLTGFPSLETATSSIQHEIAAYIQKPFVAAEFREAVARVARRKGLLHSREDELINQIGQIVRELRRTKGLTLRQLARRTNLSISLLSQVERAESACSVSTLYKVANALDITMQSLFAGF